MKLKGYVIQNDGKYKRAVYGSPNAHGAMLGGVGEKATDEEKLAAYDRLGGLILSNGRKVKTGCFYFSKQKKEEVKKEWLSEKGEEGTGKTYEEFLKEKIKNPEVIIEIRVDGEVFEYPEGKELPMEVVAKETLDKKKKEKRAKEAAEKKKKREEKAAKMKNNA